MPKQAAPPISERTARICREMVYDAARRYGVPPVHVTAHISTPAAYLARLEVMAAMVNELGLRRYQVAAIFQRDLRRVRASVLAEAPVRPKPRKPRRPPTVWLGEQRVWKFAAPAPAQPKPRPLGYFMRAVPPEMAPALSDADRATLAGFYESSLRALKPAQELDRFPK